MSPSALLIDRPQPHIVRLTLNRPGSLNALSRDLVADIATALDEIDADAEARVVILGGNGPAFCAGADLHEHFTGNDQRTDIGRSGLWDRLESFRLPLVAAVHGWAVTGGFLLAYCCDIIVASTDARFRDTHAALGLIPTGGETQRMPRKLGQFLARELMLTSRPFSAAEAHSAGLVSRVVAREDLEDAAIEMATAVAAGSPRSTQTIKHLINMGLDADLAAGLRMEAVTNRFGAANLDEDPERERRLQEFSE